ncbi:unnamed protein product [Closterium sp. NIES-54]
MTPCADLLTELEPSPVKHVTSALGQPAEVKGMGKAMFKGADGKMVGLKNIPVVPMTKERQVAASVSTKGEAVGSGYGANDGAKAKESNKCKPRGTGKQCELEESGAASKEQHKGEENPKAAAKEEYGESMWGTIASAAFSNPTLATGECDLAHPAHLSATTKFTRILFCSSVATAKETLDEVVMDVVSPLKLGAAGAEYFLIIVDVYTRMTWVYVLSKKSDVAETVKADWLPMVERQQDRLVPSANGICDGDVAHVDSAAASVCHREVRGLFLNGAVCRGLAMDDESRVLGHANASILQLVVGVDTVLARATTEKVVREARVWDSGMVRTVAVFRRGERKGQPEAHGIGEVNGPDPSVRRNGDGCQPVPGPVAGQRKHPLRVSAQGVQLHALCLLDLHGVSAPVHL